MTISSEESPRIQYAGPIAAGTTLSFPYSYIDKSQVKAQISDEDVWALDVDYSVGDESVTTISTVASGETLTLYRRTVLDQQASFPQNAKFNSEKINDALDKLTMQQQEQQEALGRSVKFSLDIDTSITDVTIPAPVAGKTLKWNDSETGLVNSDYDPDEAIAITTAAATTATTKASEASVSATNAAASASTASTKASEASVSASNAAASEANALSYKNTAVTSASNAAASEANALSYRNTAQTAATTATTKASEASTSAATATTKASEASTSASNALTSETNADSSADRAEAAASALEGVVPASGDEGKFLMCDATSYTNGVSYQEVQGGVVKFNNLGSTSSNQTLNSNEITVASFTGTPTITLPTVTDTEKQVTCILDFTTASSGQPTITNSNLRWSENNGGKAPSYYTTTALSGVHNQLIAKSVWEGANLYWEIEYNTFGGVVTDYTQPVLSSNGTWNGTSFSVKDSAGRTDTYYLFDNTNTQVDYAAGNSIYINYPKATKVSGFRIKNRYDSGGIGVASGSIYGSTDDTTYTFLGSFTNTNFNANGLWDANIDTPSQNYYKNYRIYIASQSGSNATIQEIDGIDATYIAN